MATVRIWVACATGVLLLAGVFAAVPKAESDEVLASAQAFLKEQRLYPGKVTGVVDRETEAAIRRFQMLHSLTVTGRLDEATLARMALPPVTPAVADADRRFLRELEAPAGSPPPAVASVEEGEGELSGEGRLPIPPETVKNFLELYCKAASRRDPAAELTYYAEELEYFGQRPVRREQLAEELARSRGKRARQEFVKVEEVASHAPDTVEARFTVRSTPTGRRKGTVEKRVATLKREQGGGLKLTRVARAEEKEKTAARDEAKAGDR